MNNILKFVFIYAASALGLIFTAAGGYLVFNSLIMSEGDWFRGTILVGLGILLQISVMVASTIGNTILLFDEILNQTQELYELMLNQEKQKPKRQSLPGMFNSVTIKNPNTGEETTTPLNSDNIADSINDINRAIIDSMLKGPQEPEDKKSPEPLKPKRRGRKKNLENMNLGELESELAIAIEKDDYERAVEISTCIDLLKNPPSPEENKEE